MSENDLTQTNLLKTMKKLALFAILSIVALYIGAIIVLGAELKGLGVFFALGIIIPVLLVVGALFLEIKLGKPTKIVVPGLIIAFLLVVVIAISAIGWNFDRSRQDPEFMRFLIFGVVFLVTVLLSIPLYALVKSIKKPEGNKPLQVIVAAISVIILIASTGFIIAFSNVVYVPTITNGVGHNVGPWATFHNNTEDSITITWLTKNKNKTVLYYGTEPDNLNLVFNDNNNVFLHKAVLTGLKANKTYYYRIPEAFDNNHTSTLFKFKTGSAGTTKFRFAVVGDKQPDADHLMVSNEFVARGVVNGSYDFVLNTGDLATSGMNMKNWYDTLLSLSLIGATSPLQMAIGNHDWSGIGGSTNWRTLFPYPFVSGGTASYYSFDYGNAHFVSVDNFEILDQIGEGQLRWIEEDIRDAKARGKDWIFVFFHLSIFTSATSGFHEGLKRLLLPVFDKEGVDAVFYGHDHHYEYANYTYGGNGLVFSPDHTWDHKPVQYFCTGGGGANLEVDYGLFTRDPSNYQLKWYNTATSAYETRYYVKNIWNKERYVENPSFTQHYTQYSKDGEHDGKYYYHAPAIESYANFTSDFGTVYGEQAYHYMEIIIDGKTCTIRALYPNGALMTGPGGAYRQEIVLTK